MSGSQHNTGAVILRRLREARGWSWADLARAMRDTARDLGISSVSGVQVASIQRSVARWESPTYTGRPSERNQLLLAHLYAKTRTGEVSTGSGSDFEALLSALHHFGISEERLHDLRGLVVETAARKDGALLALLGSESSPVLAQALHSPTKLDQSVITELQQVVTEVNRRVGTVPFVRLQLRLAPVVECCRRLTGAVETPKSLHSDLCILASDAFALAGRLAFETLDDSASALLYQAATEAAGKLDDSWHLAAVHASHAMVAHYATGVPSAARGIAQEAVKAAESGSSIRIRARALAVQAELSARTGLHRDADIALLRARKTIDRNTAGDPTDEFGSDRLDGFEGVCQLHTNRPGTAGKHIERCIRGLQSPRSTIQLGINTADLAMARQRLGDPRAATELLHKSVDIVASTGGRVPAQRIRQARLDLRQWRAEPFVADLDDHIHDALLAR